MIDKILVPRGFKKMASGTNRVTYRFLDDYRIVLKVAIDKVGLSDNGNEYKNQHILKPFVTKCFEVSPCGTVGLFERVIPITSREEFQNIAEDVFDLINNLIGKYVLEDIGEKFYMNYGLRDGFGPVLLDYPYVFELDGRKLICNVTDPFEPLGYCGGEIDYDLGYNNLICRKCGKRYLATELKSEENSDNPKIIVKGEDIIMKCVLKRGDEIVSELNSKDPVSVDTIPSRDKFNRMKGNLSRKERDDNRGNFKPSIKTKDEVGLKCRLRGKPKSKNIDKEAIKKEEQLERNTPKVSVSFGKEEVVEVVENLTKEQFNFDLTCGVKEKCEVKDQKDFLSTVDEIDKEILKDTETNDKESVSKSDKVVDPYILVRIKGNEIVDVHDQVIGFIKEYFYDNEGEDDSCLEVNANTDLINELIDEDTSTSISNEELNYEIEMSESAEPFDEESAYSDEEEDYDDFEKANRDGSGYTIGDIIGNQLDEVRKNINYKTENIVSEVPTHYAVKHEEVKEEHEVPNVVINPRVRTISEEELKKLKDNF